MSKINVRCTLLSRDGHVVGIELSPEYSPRAQMFCGHLQVSLVWKTGGHVETKDGALIFTERREGKVAYELTKLQRFEVQHLITSGIRIYRHEAYPRMGFTIMGNEVKDSDKLTRHELTKL